MNPIAGSNFNYQGWLTVARDENGTLYAVASSFRAEHVCPIEMAVMKMAAQHGTRCFAQISPDHHLISCFIPRVHWSAAMAVGKIPSGNGLWSVTITAKPGQRNYSLWWSLCQPRLSQYRWTGRRQPTDRLLSKIFGWYQILHSLYEVETVILLQRKGARQRALSLWNKITRTETPGALTVGHQ